MLNNVKADNGYVVLPIEKYNELIIAANRVKNAIRLKEEYGGQVAVDIDDQVVYAAAKELYETSEFNTPERELRTLNEFSVYSATLTKAVTTDE